MNDISSELVEKAKEVVTLVDTVEDNEIDPLAIDENVSKVKCVSPEIVKESVVLSDEDAKESAVGVQNGSSEVSVSQDEPKEDVKGETATNESEITEKSPENPVVEDQETVETHSESVNDITDETESQVETVVEIEIASEVTGPEVTGPEVIKPKVVVPEVTEPKGEVPEITAEVSDKPEEVTEETSLDQLDSKDSEEPTVKEVLVVKEDSNSGTEDIKEPLEIKQSLEVARTITESDTKEIEEAKEVSVFPNNIADKIVADKPLEVIKIPIFKEVEIKRLLDKKETIVNPTEEPAAKKTKDLISKISEIIESKGESKIKLKKVTEPVKEPKIEVSDVGMVELPVVEEKKTRVEEPHVVEKSNAAEKQEKSEVVEKKKDVKVKAHPVNGDIIRDDHPIKRRASEEVETESPLKRLCQEVEKTFPQHDTMINDYIQNATKNNIDEIQKHTEQLLAEIQTLRELAQKKEHEWNNILHLKKVKEEILLRLLRRKQVLAFEKSAEINGAERADPFEYLNQAKSLAIDKSDEISGLSLKQPNSSINQSSLTPMMQPVMPVTSHFNPMAGLPPPYDKAAHMNMQNMPKPVYQPMMMPGPMQSMPGFPRDMNGQLQNNAFGMPMGRQGPTKDVKSIIADYRQRNPDITPRRGRRMKSILNPNMMNSPRPIAPKMEAMNNLTNLNMLFNNLDMNQKAMLERLQQMQAGNIPNTIFKDALVQFANMQQASMPHRPVETVTQHKEKRRPEREESSMAINIIKHPPDRMPSTSPRLPPPPPYPEISLLPVNNNQETQAASQNSMVASQNSLLHGILTKNCGEITITPVAPAQPPPEPEKTEEVVQLDDEESPANSVESANSPVGSGRLVIDEGSPEAPPCQGCRRRAAQFVCAGCANQWYCSRECQVAAWDDHSDMCSG